MTLREPHASIAWPLGEASPSRVTLSAGIQRVASADVVAWSGPDAASRALDFLGFEDLQLLGRVQQLAMTNRTRPDTTLALYDGQNRINFRGLVALPSSSAQKGNLSPNCRILSAASVVSGLNLSIYTAKKGYYSDDEKLDSYVLVQESETTSSNLAVRLMDLTQGMIRAWSLSRGENESRRTTAISNDIHKSNTSGPLDVWYQILRNSTPHLELAWLKPFETPQAEGGNLALNRYLISVLRGQSKDFMASINAICSDFQLTYIPDLDGGPGRMISRFLSLTSEPQDLLLPAISTMGEASSSGTLPIQRVILKGQVQKYVLYTPTDAAGPILGGYPDAVPDGSGRMESVPLPFYIQAVIDVRGLPQQQATNPSPNTVRAGFKRVSDFAGKLEDSLVQALVTQYCRAVYLDHALANSTIQVSIPLDFSIELGRRYAVRTTAGRLFRGFLREINHSLSTASGGGGVNATTALQFSHVEFGDFTLT
jgi:hypothetical protein